MGESFPLVVAGGSVFVQIITSKKWCDLSGPRYAHSTFIPTDEFGFCRYGKYNSVL